MSLRSLALPTALLCAPLLACSATDEAQIDEVGWLINRGRYDEALQVAERLQRRHPDDAEHRETYRLATVAWLLDRGREASFANDDDVAMDYFVRAREIAPEQQVVQAWIEKTNGKLTSRWLDDAQEMLAEDNLEGALAAYERALEYTPELKSAREGSSYVLLRMNWREGLGDQYYREGVSAMRDFWLTMARYKFTNSEDKLLESDRARERREEVEHQMAEERLALAQAFEDDGLYGAAYKEYRLAELLDPGNADAIQGQIRMRAERSVQSFLDNVDMSIRRGDLEKAEQNVSFAENLTELQTGEVAEAADAVQQARWQRIYDQAYELEQDSLLVQASATYGSLLKEAGYFKDAIARKTILDEYIADAERLYARAESAANEDEAIDSLLQIHVFWPEYKDVHQRLVEAGVIEDR